MSTSITRRRILTAGAGALALSAMPTLRAQNAPKGEPIKIGAMTALSGLAAASSVDVIAGIDIAIAHANAAGGVMGRPLQVVYRDDKSNPNEAVAATRELLGSGIQYFIGGSFTALALATYPIIRDAGGLFTAMTASTSRLGHQDFNKNTFHFFPNPYMSMRSEAKVMASKYPGVLNWISVGPDVEYGHVGWSAFSTGLKDLYPRGGRPVKLLQPVWTKFGGTDYKAAASAVMLSDADGLYTTLTGSDLVTFLTQAKAMGLYEKIKAYSDIFNDVQVGKALNRNCPNNYWTGTTWYPEAPNASALSKRSYADYKAKYPTQEPLGLFSCGYGSVTAYIEGMRKAKSLDPLTVSAAMENMKFETPGGVCYYRKEDHQNVLPLGVVRMGPIEPGKSPVLEYLSVDTAEAIEAPSPGKEFAFPEPAVG